MRADEIQFFHSKATAIVISRDKAFSLLSECTGDTLWPVDYCRQRGVPQAWINELAEAFESSFNQDRDTIYLDAQATNQFHGVRDVDLAMRLGKLLGVDVERIQSQALGRAQLVATIKDELMEG